jgi:hypothetical protein
MHHVRFIALGPENVVAGEGGGSPRRAKTPAHFPAPARALRSLLSVALSSRVVEWIVAWAGRKSSMMDLQFAVDSKVFLDE